MKLKKRVVVLLMMSVLFACTSTKDTSTKETMELSLKTTFDQSYVFHYQAQNATYIDISVYYQNDAILEEVAYERQRLQQKEGEMLLRITPQSYTITMPVKELTKEWGSTFASQEVTYASKETIVLDEEIVLMAIAPEEVDLQSYKKQNKKGVYYVVATFW